jgi:DNA primase
MIDVEAFKSRYSIPAVVNASTKLRRCGDEWVGLCPFHSESTPSFFIFNGGTRFHCFGCGEGGDVLDFVRKLYNVSLADAAAMLGASALPMPNSLVLDARQPSRAERTVRARAIWDDAFPALGSPAETYIRSRGIVIPLPETIRYARLPYESRGRLYDCLIAAIYSVTGHVVGIQRTFLKDGGFGKAEVDVPKKSLGVLGGGAICLSSAAPRMIVCEGLEDGLSIQQSFNWPVWVAAGASLLPSMLFPEIVREVIIGADADEAGMRAAKQAAEKYAARGLRVKIISPQNGFKDFNDELQGRRA